MDVNKHKNYNLKPYSIDVPVLLIFWARDLQFKKVFEQVKKARPSKLFLYQDGPRPDRPGDIEKIHNCRKIAEDIDWKCDVFRLYQEKNYGCDPSEFIAQKWVFDHVDRCIILEDDDVPAQSFFPFCKELLERYADDERINIICGMNHLGISSDCPNDYFFTRSGSIWGWATWKRVVDLWEEHYDFLKDPYANKLIEANIGKRQLEVFRQHHATGRAHYESILNASFVLNNRINIVPKKNMISNVGISADSTHSVSSVDFLPKGIQRVFNMKIHETEFPLKHPKYVVNDVIYENKINRIMANGFPFVSFYRKCESLLRRLIFKNFNRKNRGS